VIENLWGRIINITGKCEPDHLNAAFAAKAGIHARAKDLSREVGPYAITMNSSCPAAS
jgi:3-oxoacyl-[acyl-carrier protein] reductase